jgi:hypothetical protein
VALSDLTGAHPFVNCVMSGEKSADQLRAGAVRLLHDADTVLGAVLFAAIDALRSLKLPGLEPKVEQAEAGPFGARRHRAPRWRSRAEAGAVGATRRGFR